MRRLAALMTLAVLSFACTLSLHAQSPITDEANVKHAEKAQKQREKEMRKAAKRQEKAMKKNEKARRKAMERAQQPANH
jgi:hypothetical protein